MYKVDCIGKQLILLLIISGVAYGQSDEHTDSADPEKISSVYAAIDVGLPLSYHAETLKNAEKSYDLKTNLGTEHVMTSIRFGWAQISESVHFGIGGGLMYGALSSTGGKYESGDINLDFTAFYLLMFGRLGYQFHPSLTIFIGLENYLPIQEKVTLTAPTGKLESEPDASFEQAAHAARLSLRYQFNPRIAFEGNLYLPPINLASIQGRGFNGLTGGIEYAL